MDESKRVIYSCTDDVGEAAQSAALLKERGKKHAGFTMVSQMMNPPKTVYRYCVFYFKE